MNQIKQRIPNWADVDPLINEFETFDDLLKIEWVAYWANHPNFYRFSVQTHSKFLMVELEEGYKWYVVGFLESVEGLPLLEWERPE